MTRGNIFVACTIVPFLINRHEHLFIRLSWFTGTNGVMTVKFVMR